MLVKKRNNLTKKNITNSLNKQIGISHSLINVFIDNTFDLIKETLYKKKIVKLKNFGVFKILKKKKRIGRNPKSRDEFDINERYVVSFKASKNLKKIINND